MGSVYINTSELTRAHPPAEPKHISSRIRRELYAFFGQETCWVEVVRVWIHLRIVRERPICAIISVDSHTEDYHTHQIFA